MIPHPTKPGWFLTFIIKEHYDALFASDAQVQEREASVGIEERCEGAEPEAGSGDHAVGEAEGEKKGPLHKKKKKK